MFFDVIDIYKNSEERGRIYIWKSSEKIHKYIRAWAMGKALFNTFDTFSINFHFRIIFQCTSFNSFHFPSKTIDSSKNFYAIMFSLNAISNPNRVENYCIALWNTYSWIHRDKLMSVSMWTHTINNCIQQLINHIFMCTKDRDFLTTHRQITACTMFQLPFHCF